MSLDQDRLIRVRIDEIPSWQSITLAVLSMSFMAAAAVLIAMALR
jgi:hypothetical protein